MSENRERDDKTQTAILRDELLRLKDWFEERLDRPGCTSQAIYIGMALDQANRIESGVATAATDLTALRQAIDNIGMCYWGTNPPGYASTSVGMWIDRAKELLNAEPQVPTHREASGKPISSSPAVSAQEVINYLNECVENQSDAWPLEKVRVSKHVVDDIVTLLMNPPQSVVPSAVAESAPINQCDGCQRGLPMRTSDINSGNWIHYDPTYGFAVMACTKDLYIKSATTDTTR